MAKQSLIEYGKRIKGAKKFLKGLYEFEAYSALNWRIDALPPCAADSFMRNQYYLSLVADSCVEAVQEINSIFAQMPSDMAKACKLVYCEGVSAEDAGKLLGVSHGRASNLAYFGLSRIANSLDWLGGYPF